jgi:4-amino-4-deoxy-L-arabinose transferase-like glycosyltransferase
MLYVSILVELLRSRPALMVWLAALAQALLWLLVPVLFYSGPPGDLPIVIAIGHEFQLGSYLGPPLAYWLAELAFDAAGHSLIGVYLLSQACIVITYWAVFLLGRSIVGPQHAALAVLLMVGIAAFTVPSPDFGPAILAMPLWALVLLHYWRAVGEARRGYWLPLAIEMGFLMLTTYLGVMLLVLVVLFTLINEHARRVLKSYDPFIAIAIAVLVAMPHLLWLAQSIGSFLHIPAGMRMPSAVFGTFASWIRQLALIAAAQAGLLVLVGLVAGWPWPRQDPAPVIVRQPAPAFARQFVYFFALVPAFAGTLLAVILGSTGPAAGIGALIVLSGLAVVLAAGDSITLTRQHIVIAAWFGLLLVPPIMAAAAVLFLPWLDIDLRVGQPAQAIARFFSDSFTRRTNLPLRIVGGDSRTAALISIGAASRPSLFFDTAPERSPWVGPDALKNKGAILVWPATGTAGMPPPALAERYSELVPELPRAFERRVQGRLPLLRIGWALLRPQSEEAPPRPGEIGSNPASR